MLPHIQEVVDAIQVLQQELKEYRQQCDHTDINYMYESNTGNWCESDDSYWLKVHCNNCGHCMYFDKEEDPTNYRLQGIIGSVKKTNLNKY